MEECGCNMEQGGCNVDPPHLHISQFNQVLSPPMSIMSFTSCVFHSLSGTTDER